MSKFNILVIEDEKNICDFITKALSSHGYHAVSVGSGATALSLITSLCPDVILLDLTPDMDGMEIIKQVRTWSDTPIIVVSARTQEDDKVLALDAGADDYLTKPFGTSELLARIRTSLRHSNKLRMERDFPKSPTARKGSKLTFTNVLFPLMENLFI